MTIAAYLLGISCQTIRLLYNSGQIESFKYPDSILLVNINDIVKLID